MELKFRFVVKPIVLNLGSNRTFMELKYHAIFRYETGKFVLIVPLWN